MFNNSSEDDDQRRYENIQNMWRDVRSVNVNAIVKKQKSRDPIDEYVPMMKNSRMSRDYRDHDQQNPYHAVAENQTQIRQLREDNVVLLEELKSKSAKLLKLQHSHDQVVHENSALLDQLQEFSAENRQLNFKIQEIEHSLEDMYQDKLNKGVMMLESNQMRQDLERAMQLLSRTQEYGELFEYEAGISYVVRAKDMLQRIQNAPKTNTKYSIKVRGDTIIEDLQWVPTKAAKVLAQVAISDDDRNEILCSMNLAFHEYWDTKVKRIKVAMQQEISNLKRQLQSRVPHEQMHANKTISRLKRQIREQPANKSELHGATAQVAQLQDCLKSIALKEKQIGQLQTSVEQMAQQLESQSIGSTYRKEIFMEGALWMIERIMKELKENEIHIQNLNEDLNKRMDSLLEDQDIIQQQIIIKIYKWLTDVAHEMQTNFKDKILQIHQATKFKLKNQNTQNNESLSN